MNPTAITIMDTDTTAAYRSQVIDAVAFAFPTAHVTFDVMPADSDTPTTIDIEGTKSDDEYFAIQEAVYALMTALAAE